MSGRDYFPEQYMDEEELFLYNQRREEEAWYDYHFYMTFKSDMKEYPSDDYSVVYDEFFDIHYYELYDEQNDIVYYENNNENSYEKRIEETE